uniref:RRM domain-containing protein n=1 Tax=Marmota marmota marmota TaxID=9994 RepID=A0A8C5ZL34_MARMA
NKIEVEEVDGSICLFETEVIEQKICSFFEQYEKVLECDIIKKHGFEHKTAAEDAICNLNHYKLPGVNDNVESSKNKRKTSTKLPVGNLSPTCTDKELQAKFEEYGTVIECDMVKDYTFVHMEQGEDALEATRSRDNTEFQGKRIHVQLSTSKGLIPSKETHYIKVSECQFYITKKERNLGQKLWLSDIVLVLHV